MALKAAWAERRHTQNRAYRMVSCSAPPLPYPITELAGLI